MDYNLHTLFHHMQVELNGMVALYNERILYCWVSETFPYKRIYDNDFANHVIAALWMHQWQSNTSVVYVKDFLRQEKEAVFREIDDAIYNQTSQECVTDRFKFRAQWALIVTWVGLRGYGHYHVPWIPDVVSVCVCACVC